MADCPYNIRRGNLYDVRQQMTDALCDLSLRIDNLGPGSSYWTLTGDDITNNNAGSVIIANEFLIPSLGGTVDLMVTVQPDGTFSTQAIPGGGGGIPDAPTDGQDYVRNDAQWVVANYFSGNYNDLTNKPTIPFELSDLDDVQIYSAANFGAAPVVNAAGNDTTWVKLVSPVVGNVLTPDTVGGVYWDGDYGDLINTPAPFVPTTFTGAGTTGYVPDPNSEQGWFLDDAGNWRPAPVSPIGGLFLNYRYNDSTLPADPGLGKVSANADEALAITELYASDTSDPGNDVGFVWENLDPGEYVGIWETTGARDAIYFVVTGPVVNNGTWYTIPVDAVTVSGDGGLDNNARLQVFFIANPNEKIPVGGTPGQVLTKQSTANFDDDWETPGFIYSGTNVVNTNSGNVGVGISSPQQLLHVSGTPDPAIRLQNFGIRTWDIRAPGTSWDVFDVSAGATRLAINNVGDVGIGIASPARRLDVTGTQGVVAALNSTNVRALIGFESSNTTGGDNQVVCGALGNEFIIQTQATQRMVVSVDGNVGIGATVPNGKLHVASDDGFQIRVSSETSRAAINFDHIDTQQARPWTLQKSTGGVLDPAAWGQLRCIYGTGFEWRIGDGVAAPAVKMKMDMNGNVGINKTSTVSATLDILYPNGQGLAYFNFNGTGSNFFDAAGSTVWRGLSTNNQMVLNHATGNLTLTTLAGSGTRMVTCGADGSLSSQTIPSGGGGDAFWGGNLTGTIGNLNTGFVGVGTNSPTRQLQVNSTQQVVASFIGSSTTARIGVADSGTTNDAQVAVGSSGNNLQLYAGAAARATVTATGSVGIGTTEPSETLDVNGGTRVRSLAGTGTRMVTTSSTGVLSSTTLPPIELTATVTIEVLDNGQSIQHTFTAPCRVTGRSIIFAGESTWTSPVTVPYIRIKYGTNTITRGYAQLNIFSVANNNFGIVNFVGDSVGLLAPSATLSPTPSATITIGGSVWF